MPPIARDTLWHEKGEEERWVRKGKGRKKQARKENKNEKGRKKPRS